MAIVNVTEYPGSAVQSSDVVQVPAGTPTVPPYDIAVGASSAAGAQFHPSTRLVRLNTDVTCRVLMGPSASVTALATSGRFAAGQTEYWGVPAPGMAIACITSS